MNVAAEEVPPEQLALVLVPFQFQDEIVQPKPEVSDELAHEPLRVPSKFEELVPFVNSSHVNEVSVKDTELPYPRSGHRLIATERYIYVLGGFNPELWNEDNTESTSYPILRELWRFDIVTKSWSKVQTKGHFPIEMASHTAVLHHNYILVFGGSGVPFGQANSDTLHALNLRNFEWRTLDVAGNEQDRPSKGYGQSAVIHDNVLYIVGGTDGFSYNIDVHCLDLKSDFSKLKWNHLKGGRNSRSLARYRHECVYYRNQLILFGGGTTNEVRVLVTLDAYDLNLNVWVTLRTVHDDIEGFPKPRKCHGLSRHLDHVYVCGGCDNAGAIYDDVWRLNLRDLKWRKLELKLPRPLFFHGFAISPTGSMYVFGGITNDDERWNRSFRFHLSPPTLKQLCGEYIILRAAGYYSPSFHLSMCALDAF